MTNWLRLVVSLVVFAALMPSMARAQTQGGSGNPSEGETQIPQEIGQLNHLHGWIWVSLFSRTDVPDAAYQLENHPSEVGEIVPGFNRDGEPFHAKIQAIRHVEFDAVDFVVRLTGTPCFPGNSAAIFASSEPVKSFAEVDLIRDLPAGTIAPPTVLAIIVTHGFGADRATFLVPLTGSPQPELPPSPVMINPDGPVLSPRCVEYCDAKYPGDHPMRNWCLRGCLEHAQDDGSVIRRCVDLCKTRQGDPYVMQPNEMEACIEGCVFSRRRGWVNAPCNSRARECREYCDGEKDGCEMWVAGGVLAGATLVAACTGGLGAVMLTAKATTVAASAAIGGAAGLAGGLIENAVGMIGVKSICETPHIQCMSFCNACEEVCEGQILRKWCAWPSGVRWDPAPFPLP